MAVIATAMCNLCKTLTDVFLSTQSKPDKKTRIPHPYQNLIVNKNDKGNHLFENQKDIETQHLSLVDLVLSNGLLLTFCAVFEKNVVPLSRRRLGNAIACHSFAASLML